MQYTFANQEEFPHEKENGCPVAVHDVARNHAAHSSAGSLLFRNSISAPVTINIEGGEITASAGTRGIAFGSGPTYGDAQIP